VKAKAQATALANTTARISAARATPEEKAAALADLASGDPARSESWKIQRRIGRDPRGELVAVDVLLRHDSLAEPFKPTSSLERERLLVDAVQDEVGRVTAAELYDTGAVVDETSGGPCRADLNFKA
jgi:hypothetical protein